MTKDKVHIFVNRIIVAVLHMIYTVGHHSSILETNHTNTKQPFFSLVSLSNWLQVDSSHQRTEIC